MAKSNGNGNESIFKTAAIGAPIAVGGAIGISRLSKDSNFFGKSVRELPHKASEDNIRQFTNTYVSKPHSGIYKEWQVNKLSAFSKNSVLTSDQIHDTWMQAARAADPSGHTAIALGDRFVGTTSRQMMEDIVLNLQKTNSYYLQKTTDIFIRNIEALNELAKQGISIDTVSPRVDIPVVKRSLGPGDFSERTWADIQKIREELGAEMNIYERSRMDIPGAELRIGFEGGKVPGYVELRIPRPMRQKGQWTGIVTRGHQQQSRFIAGIYGVVEEGLLKETFNHEEYYLRRAQESLIPAILNEKRLTQSRVNQMIGEFNNTVSKSLQWIRSVPSGTHAGLDEWIKWRTPTMHLRTPEGRPLSLLDYADIVEKGGMTGPEGKFIPMMPGMSPTQIGGSAVSLKDYTGASSLIGTSEEIGRRPMQWLRPDYAPTEEALWQMKYMDPITREYAWAGVSGADVYAPMARTTYISSRYAPQLQALGVTPEGMGIISSELAAAREVEELVTYEISTSRVSRQLAAELEEGVGRWKLNKPFSAGMYLGKTPAGDVSVLPEDVQMLEARAFEADKNKGDFIRLTGKRRVEPGPLGKVYLGGKMMAWEKSPKYIQGVMETVGLGDFAKADALVIMDELKKNQRLLYNQLFSSLWKYSKINMSSDKNMSTLMSNFIHDPFATARQIEETYMTLGGDRLPDEQVIRQAYSMAKEAKLNPLQMGRVFGALPDVFSEWESMLPGLDPAARAQIMRGGAEAFTQFFYGGPGSAGAGGLATIEPRLFELLGSPHFGATGAEIQSEIAGRMIQQYPFRLAEQAELDRLFANLTKPGQIAGAMSPAAFLEDVNLRKTTLAAEATALHIPGIGDIAIPAEGTVKQLAGRVTPEGKILESQLGIEYRKMAEQAALYAAGDINKKDMLRSLDQLAGKVGHAKALTVSGAGGLLRGRLPGSRFLTAVTPTADIKLPDAQTIGISQEYADEMFQDMERLYGRKSMAEMRARFEAGEAIAGIAARHPTIGPYSTQAVKFQRVNVKGAYAVVNEMLKNVTATGLGEEAMNLGALRFSPLVGMAGDTDGDMIAAMFASPQLERSLTQHLGEQTSLDLYQQYSIRSQVLKAKAMPAEVSLAARRAGDVIKLGIPQVQLGRVSLALQSAKAAVLTNPRVAARETMDALGLLEWLEQTPISGKHLPADKAREMVDLFNEIEGSIRKRDANRLADTARDVLARADIAGKKALREGFEITLEDIASGKITKQHIPGIRIQDTSRIIMESLRASEALLEGRLSSEAARGMLMGKFGPAGAEAVRELFSKTTLAKSPFGALFAPMEVAGARGHFAKVSSRIMTMSNKLMSMGERALTYAKPLAIGTGIAVGLSALLSKPAPSFAPGQTSPPTPDMTSGSGGMNVPPDVMMPQGVEGSPRAALSVQTANTARVSAQSRPSRKQIYIQGTMPGSANTAEINRQLRDAVGGRARINSSVSDRTTSLTPQRISNILNE